MAALDIISNEARGRICWYGYAMCFGFYPIPAGRGRQKASERFRAIVISWRRLRQRSVFLLLLRGTFRKPVNPTAHDKPHTVHAGGSGQAVRSANAAGARVVSEKRRECGTRRGHWPEYLMEATCLGLFMLSACVFTVILQHPASPVRGALTKAYRRFLTGRQWDSTAISLIYSRLGKRSGAHMNPAITLTYLPAWQDRGLGRMFVRCRPVRRGNSRDSGGLRSPAAELFYPRSISPPPGRAWAELARARCRDRNLFRDDDDGALVFEHAEAGALYGDGRRHAGHAVHYVRGTALGHEHESGALFASDLVGMQWNAIWIYFVGPLVGNAECGRGLCQDPRRCTP